MFYGEIAEILIFDRVTTDLEHAKISYYLSKKWGLESSMDSDGDGLVDANDTDPLNVEVFDFSDTVDSIISSSSEIEIEINTNGSNYVLTSTSSGVVGTGDNPIISLVAGGTYKFTHESSGHPFKITIGSVQEIISPGESKSITVPSDQSSNGSYVCTVHSSMANSVYITASDSQLDEIEEYLELWLDATNIDLQSNATLSDGDAISTWSDLSGNNYQVFQSDSSKYPSLIQIQY